MNLRSSYGTRIRHSHQRDTGIGTFSVAGLRWKYLSYEERLATFYLGGDGWPSYAEKTPEDLARAYFIYTGVQDKVQCLYCHPDSPPVVERWQDGENVKARHLVGCISHETMTKNAARYWSYKKYPMVNHIYAIDFAAWGLRYSGIGHTTCDYCGYKQTVWLKETGITEGHEPNCPFMWLCIYKESTQRKVTTEK